MTTMTSPRFRNSKADLIKRVIGGVIPFGIAGAVALGSYPLLEAAAAYDMQHSPGAISSLKAMAAAPSALVFGAASGFVAKEGPSRFHALIMSSDNARIFLSAIGHTERRTNKALNNSDKFKAELRDDDRIVVIPFDSQNNPGREIVMFQEEYDEFKYKVAQKGQAVLQETQVEANGSTTQFFRGGEPDSPISGAPSRLDMKNGKIEHQEWRKDGKLVNPAFANAESAPSPREIAKKDRDTGAVLITGANPHINTMPTSLQELDLRYTLQGADRVVATRVHPTPEGAKPHYEICVQSQVFGSENDEWHTPVRIGFLDEDGYKDLAKLLSNTEVRLKHRDVGEEVDLDNDERANKLKS